MKRSIASYLGSKLRRHAFINFLLFLEMTVALIFGAIGFEMLATAQDAIAEYPSEYERLSVVSGVYGEKQTNEEILEICEGNLRRKANKRRDFRNMRRKRIFFYISADA